MKGLGARIGAVSAPGLADAKRRGRASVLLVSAGLVGVPLVVGWFIAVFGRTGTDLLPPCLFHELTGFHCTGCGSTRALLALLHGNIAEAWGQNPLLLLVLPWLAYGAFDWGLVRFAPSHGLWRWNVPGRLYWGFAALVIAFTVVRNLPAVRFLGPLP
ncbi:MAG: DUF2752 domain-containing protein [Candidatus Eisenbacteria bacterium]